MKHPDAFSAILGLVFLGWASGWYPNSQYRATTCTEVGRDFTQIYCPTFTCQGCLEGRVNLPQCRRLVDRYNHLNTTELVGNQECINGYHCCQSCCLMHSSSCSDSSCSSFCMIWGCCNSVASQLCSFRADICHHALVQVQYQTHDGKSVTAEYDYDAGVDEQAAKEFSLPRMCYYNIHRIQEVVIQMDYASTVILGFTIFVILALCL